MPAETRLAVNVDAENDVVHVESQEPFDLHPSRVVMPFAAMDVIYHQMLAHRIQRAQRAAAGAVQGASEADLNALNNRKVM